MKIQTKRPEQRNDHSGKEEKETARFIYYVVPFAFLGGVEDPNMVHSSFSFSFYFIFTPILFSAPRGSGYGGEIKDGEA